jgi:hypothetical protein
MKRKWIVDVPEFDKVPADTASDLPTLPLSEKQYSRLLTTVPETFTGNKAQRVRAIVQLMRHSGLAIHDAVTLERSELLHGRKRGHVFEGCKNPRLRKSSIGRSSSQRNR